MNYRTRLFIGVMLMAMVLASCSEDSITSNSDTDPMHISKFEVIALDWNTVKLKWITPEGTSNAAYRIRWEPFDEITNPHDTGMIFVGDFQTERPAYSIDIGNLQPKMYVFRIEVMTDYRTAVSMDENSGAPATRHIMDATRFGEQLRLYEASSGQGNGLMIDPDDGGPTRIVPDSAHPVALQLVLQTGDDIPKEGTSTPPDLRIRVASTISDYSDRNLGDPTVWIDDDYIGETTILDDWYVSYDDIYVNFATYAGLSRNNHAYIDFSTSGRSDYFVVRMGDPESGDYRYARVVIVAAPDGTLLRGTAPNRYIELHISLGYPGVPFA